MSQTKAQLIDPVDGSIVNADINASAAIAGSKISPDFGSQNITTTGTITSNDITIQDQQPRLNFVDNAGSPNDPDYLFQVDGGSFVLHDSTNSADRLFINSSGNVGLGTSNPNNNGGYTTLTLNSGSHGGVLAFSQSNTRKALIYNDSSTGDLIFQAESSRSLRFSTNGSTERIRVDSAGRVLIGISSARANFGNNTSGVQQHIQLEGTSAITSSMSLIRNSNDANDGGIIVGKTRGTSVGSNTVVQAGDDLGNIAFVGADGTSLQFGAEIKAQVESGVDNDDMPASLIFQTNGGSTTMAERMRITSAGKVGIGSTSPTYNLEVKGSGQQVLLVGSTNAGGAYLTLDGDSNGDGMSGDYSSIGHNTSGNLQFIADNPSGNAVMMFTTGDGNEKMRLDDSGRLLLAGTSGTARFHIKGNGGDGIKIENSGGTNAATIDLKNTLTNYVKEYRIAVAGSDGAYGTAKALFVRDQTAGVNRFEIQDGGDVRVSTGNVVIGTNGKGVDFSASGNAGGMSSELLDDYEEGTWTPTAGGSGSITSSSGTYVKIGGFVFFEMQTNGYGGTGSVQINGLPFAVTSGFGGHIAITNSDFSSPKYFFAHESMTALLLRNGDNTAMSFNDTGVNGKFFHVSGGYFTY